MSTDPNVHDDSLRRTGPDRDPDPDELLPYEGWTFATAEDGDLRITEMNRLAVTHDAHATRQVLLTAIASRRGEDPLDEEFGIDVFNATTSTRALKRELARALIHDSKDHDRVETIREIDISIAGDRHANVHIEVELDTGAVEVLGFDLSGVTF